MGFVVLGDAIGQYALNLRNYLPSLWSPHLRVLF